MTPFSNLDHSKKSYRKNTYLVFGTLILFTCTISMLTWFLFPEWKSLFSYESNKVLYRYEWYRYLTSALIHQDKEHLGYNMFFLGFFGWRLISIRNMGPMIFLTLYIGGILVATTFEYIYREGNYEVLGASGGVSSVIAADCLVPKRRYCFFFLLVLGWFFWMEYSHLGSNDNIGHMAHIGGVVYGILLTLIVYPTTLRDYQKCIKKWFKSFSSPPKNPVKPTAEHITPT